MAPRVVIDDTSLTCSALDPLQSGFVPWITLYPVDKVPVPTRLDPEALIDIGEALDGLEKH